MNLCPDHAQRPIGASKGESNGRSGDAQSEKDVGHSLAAWLQILRLQRKFCCLNLVFGVSELIAVIFAILAAQSATPSSMTLGVGLQSCGTWTKDRRENGVKSYMDQSWLSGYLSGVEGIHVFGKKGTFLEGHDVNGLNGWVDNYCLTNPLDSISQAAQMLIVELNK